MGKRELLIVVAFVVIGAVAYQLSAPPPREGERGFSFAQLFSNVRREMRGNPGHASVTQEGTFDAPAALTDVRLGGTWSRLEIIGEARADIGYVLQVDSNGPDDASALGYAKQTQLKQDALGGAMILRISYPQEMRQTATLTLKVPARLAVRLDGGNAARISHVGALHLDNVVGDFTVTGVERALTGSHRNGALRVDGAGSINMTLSSSAADFSSVTGGVTIAGRNGRTKVTAPGGAVEIDASNQDVAVLEPTANVRVGASGGKVTIERPKKDVRVDGRRTEVEIALATAVGVTALTSDETLRVFVPRDVAMAIDAVSSDGGTVQATEFGLSPVAADRESRLSHAFGGARAPIAALRNQRGAIVIRQAK